MLRPLLSSCRQWSSHLLDRVRSAAPKVSLRAERCVVQRPLVYRREGGLIWYDGKIENVSRSGLLFRGEKPLSPGEVLQVSFSSPATNDADEPTQVFCWAKVVRIRVPNNFEANHSLAVKILRYRSQLQPPADIRARIGEVRGPLSMVGRHLSDRRDRGEERRAA